MSTLNIVRLNKQYQTIIVYASMHAFHVHRHVPVSVDYTDTSLANASSEAAAGARKAGDECV